MFRGADPVDQFWGTVPIFRGLQYTLTCRGIQYQVERNI